MTCKTFFFCYNGINVQKRLEQKMANKYLESLDKITFVDDDTDTTINDECTCRTQTDCAWCDYID